MTCRLYSKGRVLGHKRAKRNTRPNTSLIQIEGVASKEDAQFYLGKVTKISNYFPAFSSCTIRQRVAYVYKAKREISGSRVRVIWGCVRYYILVWVSSQHLVNSRVTRPHGSSGVVKSKFRSNLPPRAFGASVRVVSRFRRQKLRWCSEGNPAIPRCSIHPTYESCTVSSPSHHPGTAEMPCDVQNV
jgi:ribosomal protein L35AE/L33A